MTDTFFLSQLTEAQLLTHSIIFVVNIILLIFAGPLIRVIDAGKTDTVSKIRILRSLNLIVLILHIVDLAIFSTNSHYQHYFIKFGLSVMTLYSGLYLFSLISYFSRKRFGAQKNSR